MKGDKKMKKIFILIFILIILLSVSVSVYANDLYVMEFIGLKDSVTYKVTSESQIRINNSQIVTTNGKLYKKVNGNWDNGTKLSNVDSLSYQGYCNIDYNSIYYASHNIIDHVSGNVFFSPPKVTILTQTTQEVGMMAIREMVGLSFPIGILLVGSVGLWKGWKFLKMQLLGA